MNERLLLIYDLMYLLAKEEKVDLSWLQKKSVYV